MISKSSVGLNHVVITDKALLSNNSILLCLWSAYIGFDYCLSRMAPERQKAGAPATTLAPPRAWEALTPPLAEWILEAVSDMGYRRMTPVQASTIPEFMRNRDVVVEVCIRRITY